MSGAARIGKVVSAHVEEIEKFQLKLYAKEKRANRSSRTTVNRFSVTHNPEFDAHWTIGGQKWRFNVAVSDAIMTTAFLRNVLK